MKCVYKIWINIYSFSCNVGQKKMHGDVDKYIGFVYMMRNTKNYKIYIGSTKTDYLLRYANHYSLATYTNRKYKLVDDINKYGIKAFEITLVETTFINNDDELKILEQYYIDMYDSKSNGYNEKDAYLKNVRKRYTNKIWNDKNKIKKITKEIYIEKV